MNLVNSLTGTLGDTIGQLWHISWQASVLVLMIVCAQWLMGKRITARWRYALWWLLMVRLLLPVIPTTSWSIFNLAPERTAVREQLSERPQVTAASAAAPQRIPQSIIQIQPNSPFQPFPATSITPSPRPSPSWSWPAALGVLWLAIAAIILLRHGLAELQLARALRGEPTVADGPLSKLLHECAQQLQVSRSIRLVETSRVDRPAVCGLVHISLLLPVGFARRYAIDELRHIFLHELAHIKRRDLETQYFVNVLQAVHWFNPVLWWAFARMRADRELAADECALNAVGPQFSETYGETILRVLQDLQPARRNPRVVGIAEDKAQLKQRFLGISAFGRIRRWRWLAPIALVAIAGLALTDALENREQDHADTGDSDQRTLAFKALDADSGEPLNGVTVALVKTHYSGSTESITVGGGPSSTPKWTFSAEDLQRLEYRVQCPGFLAISGIWQHHEIDHLPETLEFKMTRGALIGGRVVNEAGQPIAGAEVLHERGMSYLFNDYGYPSAMAYLWKVEAGALVARTDERGYWQAACIHRELKQAEVRIRHPDYAPSVYSTEVTKEMEAMGWGTSVRFDQLSSLTMEQVLGQGIEIHGRVVDEGGRPLPDVRVRYADRKPDRYRPFLPMSVLATDAEGRFVLPHQPERIHYFSAQSPSFAPAAADLDPESGKRSVEIVLRTGRALEIEVRDHLGQPVRGAALTFVDWGQWAGVQWDGTTDGDGRVNWSAAPEDRFQVKVTHPDYVTRYSVVKTGTQHTVKLNAPLELSGQVTDAVTGRPIDSFRLLWSYGQKDFANRYAREEIDGNYSINVGRLNADGWFGGYAHRFQLRVEAPGYRPMLSRTFSSSDGDVGKLEFDFRMNPAKRLHGVVVDAENQPVKGAEVSLRTPNSRTFLKGRPSFENPQNDPLHLTNAKGEFALDPDETAYGIIVVHAEGIAWAEEWNLEDRLILKLKPWGRIEGVVKEYDEIVPHADVSGSLQLFLRQAVRTSFVSGTTDESGRFQFDYLPPHKHRFVRMIKMLDGSRSGSPIHVDVEPGEASEITIGGGGRRVEGRFEIENPYVRIDWERDCDFPLFHSIYPQAPSSFQTPEAYDEWRMRPEIARQFDAVKLYPVRFKPDGSFWIDDVRDGTYEMGFRLYDPRDPNSFSHGRYIGSFKHEFTIARDEQDSGTSSVDLGVLTVRLKPNIQKGKTDAPLFEVPSANGGEISLIDQKGKYVLLDFWATWCAPCLEDLPYLRAVHERYAGRDDVVVISLSLDEQLESVRQFLKKNDAPWLQGHLGPRDQNPLPGKYGVEGIPSIFLINPDGKIVEKGLRGKKIETVVAKHLTSL